MVTISQYFYFFWLFNNNSDLFSDKTFWDDIIFFNTYIINIFIIFTFIYSYKKIIELSDLKLNEKNNDLSLLLNTEEQNKEEMSLLLDMITEQNSKLEQKKNELSELNQKIVAYNDEIIVLAKLDSLKSGNLKESIEIITQSVCESINCSRTSIWFYNENKTIVECLDLYSKHTKSHEIVLDFHVNEFKEYYNKFNAEDIIINNDVYNNDISKVFLNDYFIPNQIFSHIDVPIFVYGELLGILSCENQFEIKEWKQEDVNFLRSVSELIALAYVSNKYKIAEETIIKQNIEIEAINKGLEERIQARTSKLIEKNAQLSEFAFLHAHVLRAPICRIIGLGNLLDYGTEINEIEKKDIYSRIINSTKELEMNLKDISSKL